MMRAGGPASPVVGSRRRASLFVRCDVSSRDGRVRTTTYL
jgi:hypothetical protein